MRNRILVLMLFVMVGAAAVLPAAAYADNALTKLTRGVVNTATGVLEIPLQTMDNDIKGNALVSATGGFASGVASAVTRTVSGIWDIVTFVLPPYDKPLVKPETLFERRYHSIIN